MDGAPTNPFVGLIARYQTGVEAPWLTDPNPANNEARLDLLGSPPPGGGGGWQLDGPCTIERIRTHPAFETLARKSISQLRDVALRRLRDARVDNLLACDSGRVTARLERVGQRRVVLAKLDREFVYESVGRISPRFKLTRAGRKLAAAPPKRIRARATLRLYDAFGDVYAYSTTFKMRRRGRR